MKKGRREIKKEKVFLKNRNTKRKMKKKNITNLVRIILLIIIFVILAIILNKYIIFDKNKTTNLVINNNNVTSRLKNSVLQEDGVIYLSEDDISNFFDKHIYLEKENNKIITTYNKKIAEVSLEENVININGSTKKTSAHAIEKDNTIYLPISEMTEVYDIEIGNNDEAKVITLDSLSKEQKKQL